MNDQADDGRSASHERAWRQEFERSMALGNVVDAEEILSARVGSAPSDFEAAALLCRRYQDRGELQRAENFLRQYLGVSPGHAPARMHLAHVLWVSGKSEEALNELRENLRGAPQEEETWKMLVNFYSELRQNNEAMSSTREWLDAIPDSGPAQYQMGHLLVVQGQYESAFTHLERAARNPEVAIDAALDMARARLQMKEMDSALRQTRECLTESARFLPRHLVAVVGLARQLHGKGQFQAVVDCCEAIRDRNLNDPLLPALHISSLKQLGRIAESEHLSARFLDDFRSRPEAKADPARFARGLWLLERFDEALEQIRESLRIRPGSERNWRTLVRWLEERGRKQESLEAAQSWLAAMPGSGQASGHLARLLVREGGHEEAREHIDRALADTTAGLDSGFEVVWACLASNRVELAADLMEKLLAVPDRIVFRNTGWIMMLARAFHNRRKFSVAENCCRAIAEFLGKDPAFLALYGEVLLSKGEIAQARDVLERSVFLAPGSDKTPRLLLALSHFHHGDAELGRAYLSEAVGFEEEGKALAALFGSAAPLIQYFGAEIDQAFDSEEVIVSSALSSRQLPDFDVSSADLVATAQLLLSRKPQLEKLVQRKNYLEMPGLRRHGFSAYEAYDDAEHALSRINSIAGTLLKRALAIKEDDVVALSQLASLYRETGKYELALACDQAAMTNRPDDHEAKISAAKSFLALERFDDAIDAAADAKSIPRDQLECIRLLPFREWGESIGQIKAVNSAEPFAYQFTAVLDGKTILIDCVIDQMLLSVAHAQDLIVIDGLVPTKNTAGHVYEFGDDLLDWISQVRWKNAFIHKINTETRVIEKPCIYLSGAGWHYQNYYHALAQNFPRLARLLDSPEYAGFSIAVPAGVRPWGLEFLKEMGVPADNLVLLPGGENVLFRHVVVPVMRRTASKDEMLALRHRLGADSRQRGTRRFFIGRRTLPSHPRLLVNEQEIAAIAAEFGFEDIDTAGMSIRQQIELFGQAAAVCGPNGAAFGNIIHAPDSTAVICMSPRETLGSWYPDLAGLCNQSFYWCFGDFLPEGRTSRQLPKLPYFIDPDDFRKLLEIAVGAGKS